MTTIFVILCYIGSLWSLYRTRQEYKQYQLKKNFKVKKFIMINPGHLEKKLDAISFEKLVSKLTTKFELANVNIEFLTIIFQCSFSKKKIKFFFKQKGWSIF